MRHNIGRETMRFDEWMDFREEAIKAERERKENAFRRFLKEVGFVDTFAYDYSYADNKFTIYTSQPGMWIGYKGKNVALLKEILHNEVYKNCDVGFKEIRGHFVAIK
jgi:ribosomal protein S3